MASEIRVIIINLYRDLDWDFFFISVKRGEMQMS